MNQQQVIDSRPWSGLTEEPPVEAAQQPIPPEQRRDLPPVERHMRLLNWGLIFQLVVVLAAINFINSPLGWWINLALFFGCMALNMAVFAFIMWLSRKNDKPPHLRLDASGLIAGYQTGGSVPWSAVGKVSWNGPRWMRQLHVQVDPERTPPFRGFGWTEKLFGARPESVPGIFLSGWTIAGIDDSLARLIMEYRDNYCRTGGEQPE